MKFQIGDIVRLTWPYTAQKMTLDHFDPSTTNRTISLPVGTIGTICEKQREDGCLWYESPVVQVGSYATAVASYHLERVVPTEWATPKLRCLSDLVGRKIEKIERKSEDGIIRIEFEDEVIVEIIWHLTNHELQIRQVEEPVQIPRVYTELR